MVMVGGVEIAVDLNLEGIEQTLKELEKQFNSTKFGVNVGIDASAYNKLQQDINRVRDRVVVKKICVPIDICDDSINKVERKFYAIKRKLENNPINIKVNYSQQKGGVSGSGSVGKGSGIDKGDIKNIGRDIVDELKALRKDVVSGFGNSVSSTNNTTSAIGPIRMIGSVVSELKTISKNTKKQGLISSLVGSAIDGFVMGAMNKSGAKFSENFNKILNKNVAGQISKTQSRIKQSQENIGHFQSSIRTSQRLVDDGKRQRPLVQESIARKQEQVLQKREQIKLLDQEKNTALFPQTKAKIDAQIEIEKNIINQINEQIQLEKQFIEVIDIQSKREAESIYRMVDKIKAEETVTKKLSQELKKLETKLDDSFDFLGGKQLAVKAIRLKKFGDSVAKNVFAFNDLKEVKDVTLDSMGTFFNAFTDEKFYKEMEDTYVDYMQQVEILGKDAKVEQEKAIKRLTGRFDRVSERVSARVIGGTLKSVAQPLRVNKRVTAANSAKMAFEQLPYMENTIAERKDAMAKSEQIILFMGGVQPMMSKPGQPMVDSTHVVGNILAGVMPNTYVEKVTNEISNAVETIEKSPTFGARKFFGDFVGEHKERIDQMFPGNTLSQDMGSLLAAHPIDRAIQVNFQGFDEDAVKLVIRALTIAKEFPDKKIALMGGSGGGYSVEEAMAVLEQFEKQYPEMAHLTKNIVGGLGVGTPNFNLTSTASPDKFKYVLGSQDHFSLGVLGHQYINPSDPKYAEVLNKLPGGARMPTGTIRPAENFRMLKNQGFDHNIGKMVGGFMKYNSDIGKASEFFGEEKLKGARKPGSPHIYQFKDNFGSIESALWHLTEQGQANKWSIDESLMLPLEELKRRIDTPDDKFQFENGIRLQQTWMASRKNLIRGGYSTPEGKLLEPLIDRVGDEIAKLKDLGYKDSLFKVLVNETGPDTVSAKAEGFLSVSEAQEWVKNNVDNTNSPLTEITPHLGDVLWKAQNIDKDTLLPEVIEKFNKMPSATPLEKQLKSVVGAFIDFQKKDVELYKRFLQDVYSLRKRIADGDDSAKTELVDLLKSSAFSVVKGKITGKPLATEAKATLGKADYATFPGMNVSGVAELESTTQNLLLEYIQSGGTVTDDIKTKATELAETYKFLSDGLNSLYKTIKNEAPPPVPDSSFINDPTSFQSLLNLNTQLPEQYQLNPYSSKVLGEGFTGRAIGDMEKGIVVKYPTVMMEDVRAKIGSPLEVEAQEKLGQKGLSPLAIKEATKQGEFFTATLIKGKTLQSIRDTVDSTKLKKVAKLLADIHKEGFVHLDMSLANIMETEAGDLVAIDFANVEKATKDLMKLDLERVIERSRLSGPQAKELTAFYQEEIKDFAPSVVEKIKNSQHGLDPVAAKINSKLPEQYQIDPYTSKVLGEGFNGRAIGDIEKGIVLKYPKHRGRKIKIATPEEIAAQQALSQKGLSPAPIPEASKEGEYLTTTFVKGVTLQSIRDTVDSNKLKKIAKLLVDIHKEGWVHLDMALANIMETETGDLVAIDFANAKKATKDLMKLDVERVIERGSLEKPQAKELRQYYKEYMDQISAVPMPDTSNITQEVEKVQQTVSSGIAGTVKKYLEELGKEIYAVGLDKTLNKESAQEAINRIDNALEGLKRLKEVLPSKIPSRKGKLAPTGQVLSGYSKVLRDAKANIVEGAPQVPINFKLGQLTKDIVAGLELTGSDAGALIEFADSITDPVTGRIKENWEIQSPSRLMKYFKMMLIAGLEIGGQEQGKLKAIGDQFANSISGQIKNAIPVISQELQSVRNKLTGNIAPDPSIERQQRKNLLINKLRIKGTPINPDLLENAKATHVQSDFNSLTPRANFLKGWANLKENIKFLGQDLQEEMQSVSKKMQEKSKEIWNSIFLTQTPYGQSRKNQLRASLQMKGVALPQQLAAQNSGFKSFSQQANQVTNPQSIPSTTQPKPSFDWMSPLLLAGQIGSLIAYKDTLIDIGRVSIDVAKEFSVLTNTLNFLSGGVDKGTEKFNQLKEMSNDMGVNFKTVVQSYNQLAASTRNTSLEGAVTDELIKGITQAGVTFGLSSEEIQGSILAVSQIAGKGVVSAEELRGQLAERIPGAFQIAARSMKMTEKELYQLMATGQMASTDFLPKFARQLSLESGAGVTGASELATASINKLNNSIEAIQLKIGSALLPLYTLGVKIATVGVEFANSNLVAILRGMVTGFISLTMASGQFFNILKNGLVALAKWIGLSNLLGKAINMTKGAWIALGKSMAAMMAKSLAIYATIEIGIGIFKVFQAEFGKSTVYDQWANNIESNVDRVNEAIKSSVNSMTQLSQVKPSNQIASSGNWWLEMGENALGLVGMDSRSQLDKAVKKENEKRAKEGKAPVSQAEIQSATDTRNNINRSQLGGGTRQKDEAIVTREKLSRMRDENFYNPIQRVMEQYKFSNAGPLAEIEQLDKKIKGLKAQQAVLDPADVETAQKLTKEIGLAEKAKQDLLGPLDAQEAGLRQSLKDDQELLDKYNQAIIDQNSDDKEKRKAAEEFLRKPGHDPQSMEQVSRDIDQTTTALNNYQREQARSGAVNDIKKLAMAMMELGIAFSSVEKRMNAIHISKLKGIAQLRLNGFSSDRFNDVNTGVATAEENYNNTQRQLAGRKETMQRLEADLAKNPSKTAADQLIAAEEEKRGRKLTGEEINMLSEIYAKEGQEQLKQAMMAEAALREERMKTADMEKQSVEEQYAIREARQARYLAIYEDAMDEMKQLDQRALSAGLQGANNELIRNLQTDLGADDKFNIKAGEIQFANIQKQIENIPIAMQSLKQAYEQGDLSLEQYTTKSRALLTEEAQLKQQLVEQELANIRTVSQVRMNELQRIKEERDANTEIANSGRTEAITKNSISKFRTDEFLTNNESLAQAKNGLVEIQNQLKNTNSELSELEEAYASGDLLLNDYVQKKRQLLITQAQQESQLATAEMARMRAIEDYRLAMLDRMRDVSNNKNAILNAEALTQLAQSQMTGQVGDSQASRQSTEIALDNARKAVEVAKESLAEIQKAYRKKELSAEKYQERLRAINLEIAQANQSVAEQELALWKAKEQEKISILEKSLEKQDRLNKLNAIKLQITNKEKLISMTGSGGATDLASTIIGNQETNAQSDSQIKLLQDRLGGMKGILNPTKELQEKILATEHELNESVLNKRLTLLGQQLDYKKQMLTSSQMENKAIDNQLALLESRAKLEQAIFEGQKKALDAQIAGMERVRSLGDEIGAYSLESIQIRAKMEDVIAQTKLKSLEVQLKMNQANLMVEQQRDKLNQVKAENDSRLAVIQAKQTMIVAQGSGNKDAIALAGQQLQIANEGLSTVIEQGALMQELHSTQQANLEIEQKATREAENFARVQENINNKVKTMNSYLDKQKERLDSINELNKAINNSKTNVLEKQTGISDRKIDLYDTINGTEKITDPTKNAVLMKELEAQLKAIGGSTDPEAMYAERLRLEESLANQKMNALVAEQNMQKTLLQIEFDKYELQAQALILQAKMLALQSKGTENEASANQLVKEAMEGMRQLGERRKDAMDALGINQETERYNQGIENANAINDTRRKAAEAGYKPKGDPAKYPTATGEAGKTIKELLTGDSQRFGYAPSFDLNQAVKGLKGGNGIDIGRVNIPSPSNEPTYMPLNINEELLTPNLTENTERNTKAMYDLSNSIISLTEALVNNKPGLEINAPVANNNPVSTPTGQPTTTGGQQVINNVNYGGVTVISSDPTGDARKVLNDLAKVNKNKL